MQRAVHLILLSALLLVAARAEDRLAQARQLNNQAAGLYARGQLEAAEPLYRAALAQSAGAPILAATISTNLGALCKRLDRYTDAEKLYQQALDLRRQSLPRTRPEIADSMNNLGEIYRLEGRYWEARNLTMAAVRALEQADPASPDMPIFLNNWAGLERDLHHPEIAEPLLRRAWTLAEVSGGPAGRPVAIVLNSLGQVLADKRDFANAEPLYRRAAGIFEKPGTASSHDRAAVLCNLGRLLAALGRADEARATEFRALALLDAEPHSDILLRATILHNMGRILVAQGDLPDALPYFERSLAAEERILGPENPRLAGVLADYSDAACRAGDKSRGRKLGKRAGQLLAREHHDDRSSYTVDASARY